MSATTGALALPSQRTWPTALPPASATPKGVAVPAPPGGGMLPHGRPLASSHATSVGWGNVSPGAGGTVWTAMANVPSAAAATPPKSVAGGDPARFDASAAASPVSWARWR